MNEELETKTLSVSCLNALSDDYQRYGQCVWPTDPILFEVNKKLDKILAILNKD